MVVFVILHYCGLEDTIKCIESLLSTLNHKKFKVVVVDNDSADNSGQYLIEKYETNDIVHVIINEQNYGFSKGNNIGCSFSIENYSPDFLCVINNDTYIEDKYFIEKIYQIYNNKNFDILGPKIWNINRKYNQNPFKVISSLEEVNEAIKKINLKEKLLFSKLPILFYLYSRFGSKLDRKEKGLHGAALIFSSTYYNKYDTIFPEVTFMYGEENLLYYRKIKDGLTLVYNPEMEIFHNHSSSTKLMSKNIVNKWRFQHRYIKEALYLLKEIYLNKTDI